MAKNTVMKCVAVWMVADHVLERVLVENGLTVKIGVTVPVVL